MLVEVALPVPLPRTYTYELQESPVPAGTRVRVRFGPRRMIGWIVGPSAGVEDPSKLKAIEAVLDAEPTLPADLLDLCRWISDYYLCPLGLVVRSVLPAVLSDTAREDPHVRTRRVLRLARELPSLLERDELFGRARRQRECYEFLEATGGSAEFAHLTGQLGFSETVLRGLVQRGLAVVDDEALERDPFAALPAAPPLDLTLTVAQQVAVAALTAAARSAAAPGRDDGDGETAGQRDSETGRPPVPRVHSAPGQPEDETGPKEPDRSPSRRPAVPLSAASAQTSPAPIRPFLLRGVTGSGKTLVYIELLKEIVGRQGLGAIVLVPEIALTPQTVARFRSHFGDDVAVLHSALSEGERYDAWRALRRGDKRIAVGARSAVFAPIPDLGAIVIDEEHEGSYKQSEAPRYHAREVAIVRASRAGAVCLLGSATPSLESWHNARRGKFELLELPERVEGRPLPPVRLVDLRNRPDSRTGDSGTAGQRDGASGRPLLRSEPSAAALPKHRSDPEGPAPTQSRHPAVSPSASRTAPVLSDALVLAMRSRLDRNEQTILLLNRRGYSTFVQCRDCGAVWHCRNCNVSLTYHRSHRRMVCHYCFHEEPPPVTCPCGSADISFRGVGTEQVERTVAETFPTARLARMDVDTTTGKWSHHEILSRVEKGEVDILLGTQMIAKGLDFPRVTLVGVINADVGMNLPDFRASERTFQLLTQVSGRAGRGPLGGEVLVQTALPGHYAIRAALDHDFTGFAEREIEERRGPGYPPHSRLLNVILSGTEEDAVQRAAEQCAEWLRLRIRDTRLDVSVVGPAPCPVDRVRNRWRWHFLLRTASARSLARAGRELHHGFPVRPGPAELRLVLDRDPVSLL